MIERIKAFATVLKQSKHPVRMITAVLLAKTGLHRFFSIRMDGYKIHFSKSALALTLFADSKERHEDEDFLHRILKSGETYADIGANIGTLVLTAASIVGPNGNVIGIEAHPVTFKHLEANVTLNKFSNIVLINSAAGEKQGTIVFSNINSDDQNKVLTGDSKGIEVKVDTADHIFSAITKIDLLKIDVEGYEKFVLQGAAATLKKTNIVFFESWEKHFNGFDYNTGEVINIFRQNGFEVYKPAGNELLSLQDAYQSVTCENLLALKNTNDFCSEHGYTVKR